MMENAGDTTPPRYIFYGMTHEGGEMQPDGSETKAAWVDGVWVLGPTLNSERCTAFLEEGDESMPYPVSSKELGLFPDRYSQKQWQVFDVVGKAWQEAPGSHCPAFSIEMIEETVNGMNEYIQTAIDQQTHYLDQVREEDWTETPLLESPSKRCR